MEKLTSTAHLCGILYHFFAAFVGANYVTPSSTWPLTNKSFGEDVGLTENDAILTGCVFSSGYLPLSTNSLSMDGTNIVEIVNNNYFDGDFMLSALFYPTVSTFVMFNFQDASENEIFKVSYSSSTIHIAVKDSDGTPLASVSESYNKLTLNSWHHIGFLREKANGLVKLFNWNNKVVDVDDSFPDSTPLPSGGKLRIAGSFSSTGGSFTGRVSCMQIFPGLISEGQMKMVQDPQDSPVLDTCSESIWIGKLSGSPEVTCQSNTLVPATVPPPSTTTTAEIVTTELPTTTTTVNPSTTILGSIVTAVLDKQDGYFILHMRNNVPVTSGSLEPVSMVRSRRECGGECLKHVSCLSFTVMKVSIQSVQCTLHDTKADTFTPTSEHLMYYIRINI